MDKKTEEDQERCRIKGLVEKRRTSDVWGTVDRERGIFFAKSGMDINRMFSIWLFMRGGVLYGDFEAMPEQGIVRFRPMRLFASPCLRGSEQDFPKVLQEVQKARGSKNGVFDLQKEITFTPDVWKIAGLDRPLGVPRSTSWAKCLNLLRWCFLAHRRP